jgi:hypothetical protein
VLVSAGIVLRCAAQQQEILINDWTTSANELVDNIYRLARRSWHLHLHPGWDLYRHGTSFPNSLQDVPKQKPYAVDCRRVEAVALSVDRTKLPLPSFTMSDSLLDGLSFDGSLDFLKLLEQTTGAGSAAALGGAAEGRLLREGGHKRGLREKDFGSMQLPSTHLDPIRPRADVNADAAGAAPPAVTNAELDRSVYKCVTTLVWRCVCCSECALASLHRLSTLSSLEWLPLLHPNS